MLRFCSYLVCEINSPKALLTPNLSQIGRFLKIWTQAQIFGHRQKCSDLAQIWCEQCFWWIDFTHQIWAKSDHFRQSWKLSFWVLTLLARFSNILKRSVWELTDIKNLHNFWLKSIEKSKFLCGVFSNKKITFGSFWPILGVFAPLWAPLRGLEGQLPPIPNLCG